MYISITNAAAKDQIENEEVVDGRDDVASLAFFGTLPAAPTLNAEN